MGTISEDARAPGSAIRNPLWAALSYTRRGFSGNLAAGSPMPHP